MFRLRVSRTRKVFNETNKTEEKYRRLAFYLLGIQAVPPTVFEELHNVIPNPVAEAWVVKLVEITINPSAVTIVKIVNIVFVFINNI